EEAHREGSAGGSGLRTGDGDVGEVVGAEPGLHEVDEPLLGGAQRSGGDTAQGALALGREVRDGPGGVDGEEPAVIDQRLARGGLRDPGGQPHLVERGTGGAEDRHDPAAVDGGTALHHAAPRTLSAVCVSWSFSKAKM